MAALSFDVFWRDHGAAKGLQGLSTHASRAHSAIGTLAKVGVGAFTGLAVAGGAAAAAAGAFGVKVASGNEQARISFTTMLGSAKRANVFLKQLQQFAAKTPFEFPELQTAASSLISVGIKADKIIPIMTSLGNATAGMGTGAEGVKRATVALQQMTAAGRITAQDLNQLRDAGVPVFELLTKATGKSTAEIAKMAQNGKLGRKELEQLMKALESGKGLERFAGLMDKQSQSLAGLWSTFKDTAGQMLAGLATTAFPLMKSGLAAVSTELGHLGAWVKDNRESLGTVFKVLGSTLTTLGGTVSTVFKSFAQSAGLGKSSFKDFADFLATHQEAITRGIVSGGKAFIAFGRTVAVVASGALRGFGLLADGIGVSVAFVLGQYADMAHGAALAFGWIPGIGPKLQAADIQFRLFATGVHNDMHKTGDSARSLADGIDRKVIPAFDKAGRGLDVYGKKAIAAAHAKDVIARAENRHRDALAAASAAAKTNGRTLDSNTISGRANRVALNGLVSSSQNYIAKLVATHASSKRVTAATAEARAEFVRVAAKMGVSRDRAQEMANKLIKVRGEARGVAGDIKGIKSRNVGVDIHFKANSKSVAATMAANVKTYAATIQRTLAATQARKSGGYTGGVVGFGAQGLHVRRADGGVMPGYTPGRDVHSFYSPTAGQLDLSGGEAVMRPEWTRAVGGPREVARMNADARNGRLRAALASGGVFDLRANYNRAPSFGDINAATARTVDLASAFGSVMGRIVASTMTTMTKNAEAKAKAAAVAAAAAAGGSGGPIGKGGYASALSYARAHRGHPYIFGSLWDCCIVGPVRVYGPDGARAIRDLRAGDRVYSYVDGRVETHTVTAQWQSKTQPVFKVRTRNRAVIASANHPFMRLVRVDKSRQIPGGGRGQQTRDRYDVQWARLDELQRGDLLVQPRSLANEPKPHPALSDGTVIDADVAWLIGAMVGDGSINRYDVRLCLYGEKRDRAVEILRARWNGKISQTEKHGIILPGMGLVGALTDLGMKHLGPDKRVPDEVWLWSADLQRAFLEGYCDADGHRPANPQKHGDRTYHSASRELIEDVRALHIMLGDPVSNITVTRRAKPIIIKGKTVKNALPLHTFTLWQGKGRGEVALRTKLRGVGDWLDSGEFTLARVLEVRDEGVQDTYDIEVEGAHNFIADGVVVHNSGFMSALHSIILGQRPHRRYTTTAFHGAHAAGFTRGKSSPFMVGVRPLSGKFGHMAGTLNGVNVESAGGVGVRVGGGARGAHSGMFSWRGGLAGGGVIRVGRNGVAGDLPFDLLDPQGQRYNPELADLLHKAGYHRGGSVGERGPERILSPAQNRNFENLVRAMDRRGGATVVHNHYTVNAPHYVGNHQDLVNALVKLNSQNKLAVLQR